MDLWDLIKLLFRRWYITAPLILITALSAWLVATLVPADYRVTGDLMLVPPTSADAEPQSTPGRVGRWTVTSLTGALVIFGGQDALKEAVAREGPARELQVQLRQGRTDVVEISVSASSRAEAYSALERTSKLLTVKLADLQEPFLRPGEQMISAQTVDLGNRMDVSTSKPRRVAVVIGGMGVLLTAAASIVVDAFARRRAHRQRMAGRAPSHDQAEIGRDISVSGLPMTSRLARTERPTDEPVILAAALYEFYDLDNRIDRHDQQGDADDPMVQLRGYYDPILEGVDSATRDIDYAFNLLGPPPESLGSATGRRPHTPIGSAQ
ncbi:hypothetical protein ACQP2E_15795 [Actinoplanes sp. CA-015351]|uniref:hypothetical protein n=1 Tax=Actinoplanes sp. CA-015351 TaxID=3239897 RepID=UPI003D9A082A